MNLVKRSIHYSFYSGKKRKKKINIIKIIVIKLFIIFMLDTEV